MQDETIIKQETTDTEIPLNISEKLFIESTLVQNATKEQIARGRIGRNETCPCGSGKKFKKCCYYKVK